jgi:hypothetical protein
MTKIHILPALLLSAMPAMAATVSYNGTFNNNPGAYPTVFNTTVPQFNPALGTLNSVTLQITSDSSANVEYENEAASGGSATANLIGTASGTFSSLSTSVVLTDTDAATITVDDEVGIPDFAGGDYHDYGLLADSDVDSDSAIAGLGAYIGAGVINLSISDNQGWSVSGVGDGVTRVTLSRSSHDWLVIYDYTPVPEPTTAGLSLLALAALGRRRR